MRLRARVCHECARRWLVSQRRGTQTGACDGPRFPLSLVSNLPVTPQPRYGPELYQDPKISQGTVSFFTSLGYFPKLNTIKQRFREETSAVQ